MLTPKWELKSYRKAYIGQVFSLTFTCYIIDHESSNYYLLLQRLF